MGQPRIRIADIADALGVSTATVSNVIHGKTKKISAETVRRVELLLEEKQYIPSMAGILLAQNASKIIGVAINRHSKYEQHVLQDPFIAESLDCLEREIDRCGYFMMVKCMPEPQQIVRFGSMWNMEGMVILGFCGEDYEALRAQMHIPFVVYDGYSDTVEDYVNLAVDDYSGGFQIGSHLASLGHRRVLFIADNDICMDHERRRGLCDAIEKAVPGARVGQMLVPMQREARLSFYAAHLSELLSYTAVFAASDAYALELMDFLADNGIAVPGRLSVAGFDGIPQGRLVRPSLTTVQQDGAERARMALSLLGAQKAGAPFEKCIRLPVTLRPGGSTGPAAEIDAFSAKNMPNGAR